jgi:hypothetical protein
MICSKCQKETPHGQFATFKDRNGVNRRRGICRQCRNQYAIDNFEERQKYRKSYYTKNRSKKRQKDADRRAEIKKVIDKIKAESPCVDCGRYFPPVAMDFDHVRGKTKGVANFVSGAYKLDLILEEIKLCELVCACCHRIRTARRKDNLSPVKK